MWAFTEYMGPDLRLHMVEQMPFHHQISETMNNGKYEFVFQLEKCPSTGRPHWQGAIKFKSRTRIAEHPFFGNAHFPNVNWTRCKGTWEQNIAYCTKSRTRIAGPQASFRLPEPLKLITELRPWQQDLDQYLTGAPDDRTILWYTDTKGSAGKTAFLKWYLHNHPDEATFVGGKCADAIYAVKCWMEAHNNCYPRTVFINVPRSVKDYVSYQAIESIKDGLAFSAKYESGGIIGNSPHVVVFSNQDPEFDKLSADRWSVKYL